MKPKPLNTPQYVNHSRYQPTLLSASSASSIQLTISFGSEFLKLTFQVFDLLFFAFILVFFEVGRVELRAATDHLVIDGRNLICGSYYCILMSAFGPHAPKVVAQPIVAML